MEFLCSKFQTNATIIEQIAIKQDQPATIITTDTKEKYINTSSEITKPPVIELQKKVLQILYKHNNASIMAFYNKIIKLFTGYLV